MIRYKYESVDRLVRMNDRVKSAIATILIHLVIGYALVTGLAMSVLRHAAERMSVINLAPEPPPPLLKPPPPPKMTAPPGLLEPLPSDNLPPEQQDYATLTPFGRVLAVIRTQKWVVAYVKAERARIVSWRLVTPQGTGGARVTRLKPPNLTTHTVYWPAESKALLPIIAWGNGMHNMCFNSSLPYAEFLSEIASHGYFIVAVGYDDIDYPLPGGGDTLPDGRSVKSTQSIILRKGIDWAIAENSRAGSPYQGRLDTSKIAYMGHGCGGGQAMLSAIADPRTTTTVVLNASARFRRPSAPEADPDTTDYVPPEPHKWSLAHFEGLQDDAGVLSAGDASMRSARAAEWPMFKAALEGIDNEEAYRAPDKRWMKAVVAWLDWQLKGDTNSIPILQNLWREKWGRIDYTGL